MRHTYFGFNEKAHVFYVVDLEMPTLKGYPLQIPTKNTTESKYCIYFLGR